MVSNIITDYLSFLDYSLESAKKYLHFLSSAKDETQEACFKFLNLQVFLGKVSNHRPFIYRERTHVNSKGFNEFCIRNIERHSLGRREIELAELEMPGILALRQEDILKFFPIRVSIIFLKS